MFHQIINRRCGEFITLCLLILGSYQLSGAAIIEMKAWLAPVLIEKSWNQTLLTGKPALKPWPWADTWPVGRLQVAALNVDLLVLEGDSGNALAFGPGRALPSAELGAGSGTTVIGGHRDTHFAFLEQLRKGQLLQIQLASGKSIEYQVRELRVVDSDHESLLADMTTEKKLLLVTCYPFDALLAGGPLRYVVTALPTEVDLTESDMVLSKGGTEVYPLETEAPLNYHAAERGVSARHRACHGNWRRCT